MDKPLCRVCGQKHWNSEPHRFGSVGSPSAQQSASRSRDSGGDAVRPGVPAVSVKGGDSATEEKLERLAELEAREADRKRKHREYMREYMRKYRERKGG